MKYFFPILLSITLLCAGCAKDLDVTNGVDANTEEKWKKLPNISTSGLSNGVIATEFRNSTLHINTQKAYIGLDTSLNHIETSTMSTRSSDFQLWAPQYGNTFGLLKNESLGLTIFDLSQPTNFNVSLTTGADFWGEEVANLTYSNVSQNSRFSTLKLIRDGEFAKYILQHFTIRRTAGPNSPIEIIENLSITVDSVRSAAWPGAEMKVYRFNDQVIVNINRFVYVYNNSGLVKTSQYFFKNMFERNGVLYAAGDTFINQPRGGVRVTKGLFISYDMGVNWHFVGESVNLLTMNFKLINENVFAYNNYQIGKLNLGTGYVDVLKTSTELSGISCLEKVHDQVIVGTQNGVYTKSWESFLSN